MNWQERILAAAALLTAVLTLCAGVKKIADFSRKCTAFFTDTAADLKELKERQHEMELAVLRMTLIDGAMPLSERLAAGQKYVAMGGNGDCKALYNGLKEKVDGEETPRHLPRGEA